jgi:hypothetical protein
MIRPRLKAELAGISEQNLGRATESKPGSFIMMA